MKLSDLAEAIVESSADAILGVSPGGIITSSNAGAQALLGYASADLAGLPLHALSAGGHEALAPVFRRAVAGERIVDHQSAWKRRDGTEVAVRVSLTPLRQSGAVSGVAVIARDVSPLSHADEALQESDQRFRALMRAVGGVIFIVQGTRLIDISPSAEAISGYSREELIAKGFDLLHPDDRDTLRERALARQRGETVPASFEVRALTREGRERSLSVSVAGIRYKGASAVLGLCVDITDRKRAAAAARDSETGFRLVIATLDEGVVVHDRDGVITSCNASAQRILGLRADEIVGPARDRGWRAVHEDGSPFPRDAYPAVATLRTGVPQSGVVMGLQRPNAPMIWVSVNSHPLVRPGQDGLDGAVSSFTDITQRKRTEEMLRASEELERRARLTAEMLRTASLDLTRSLRLDQVLVKVLDYLNRLVPYDTASVLLLEPTERLVLRAARGYAWWTTEPVLGTALDPEQHPLLWAQLVSQESRIVADTRGHRDWHSTALNAHVRSWLAVPLVAGLRIVGIYSLESAEPGSFTTAHREAAESFAAHAAVAIQNAGLYQDVKAARERLQIVSRQLLRVQEAERRAIARELHDEIGQVLTGLRLTLEPLPGLSETERTPRLEQAAALLNQVISQVREISLNLRPAVLDDLGLLPALLSHVDRYHAQTGTRVQFEHAGLAEPLPSDVATAAYRIVQEALTNVARHAGVKDAGVSLRLTDGALHVLVEDHGRGFAPPHPSAGALSSGLAGMRERAELLGGTLLAVSTPGAGTRIIAWLPIAASLDEPLAPA